MWGTYIDSEIDMVGERPDKKASSTMRKRQMRMNSLLQTATEGVPQKGKFRDPAEAARKK